MENQRHPICSLVIRCFNEEEHIGRLLAGVMEQSVKDVEIIVVDSGSTDATISIASRYPVKVVNIRPEAFSFGHALNVGCAAATGEFLVMASAHVYPVYKDWLENLIRPFVDGSVALVYGKQRGDASARYTEQQIYKRWFPDVDITHQKHPFCNNANAAVRRSLWQRLPYDENLTGLEDLDWATRAIKLGSKIVYSADAEIIHIHNETPKKIYNRYRREAIAFKHIFPHERFNFLDFIRLVIANTFTDYYHAFKDGVLARNIFSIPVFRSFQFWGTYAGYRQHGMVTQQLRNRFYYPEGLKRQEKAAGDKEEERTIHYEHH